MSNAPERIWAWETLNCNGQWTIIEGDGTEYVRADLLAAQAETIAALIEALDAALQKPMGVVPKCAERFYDGTIGSFTTSKAKGLTK